MKKSLRRKKRKFILSLSFSTLQREPKVCGRASKQGLNRRTPGKIIVLLSRREKSWLAKESIFELFN
jgi:hypothetical protein